MKRPSVVEYFVSFCTCLTGTAAFALAGAFDTSFNGVGFTRNGLPENSNAAGVAIHSTGEIVTAGQLFLSPVDNPIVLWRHLPDGTPDERFGNAGAVNVPSQRGAFTFSGANLAIDSQDRIILIALIIGPLPADVRFLIYRFNFDGSADTDFGDAGIATVPVGTAGYLLSHVITQSDGKIIGVGPVINPASGLWEFFVFRLLESGQLDPSFGDGGRVWTIVTDGGGDDRSTGVALQPDGKIIVAGRARTLDPAANYDFALARYLPDGELDPSFGDGGKVTFPMLDDDLGRKVGVQRDGKIVIGGYACEEAADQNEYCFFGVARVDAQGVLDPSFGGTGKVLTDVGDGFVYDVAVQSDDKIVAVGLHRIRPDSSASNNVLVRYMPDGSLDGTFGRNGISETNFGYVVSNAAHLRLRADDRVVVAGATGNHDHLIQTITARYLANGQAEGMRSHNSGQLSSLPMP